MGISVLHAQAFSRGVVIDKLLMRSKEQRLAVKEVKGETGPPFCCVLW